MNFSVTLIIRRTCIHSAHASYIPEGGLYYAPIYTLPCIRGGCAAGSLFGIILHQLFVTFTRKESLMALEHMMSGTDGYAGICCCYLICSYADL